MYDLLFSITKEFSVFSSTDKLNAHVVQKPCRRILERLRHATDGVVHHLAGAEHVAGTDRTLGGENQPVKILAKPQAGRKCVRPSVLDVN
ncbi:MAG: hypothetical protein J6T24_02505 [Clostridia bacterium]|nr:hypothetical protein [Clostridia bacterium]